MLTRRLLVLPLLLTANLQSAHSFQLENISDKAVKKLRTEFSQATIPNFKQLGLGDSWDCRLYGMRSRMQVAEKTNFYQFKTTKDGFIQNDGLQVVRSYQPSDVQLEGNLGPITDAVRITKDHRLIAELSIPNKSYKATSNDLSSIAKPKQIVLAYTICDTKVAIAK